MIRWATLKGLVAIILFLIVAVLIEWFIVLYAVNLGVKDEASLIWSFGFPATDWIVRIVISPLFHLVPVAVIITLVASWTYLTRYAAVKFREAAKVRVEPSTKRGSEQRLKGLGKKPRIRIAVKKFFVSMKSGLLRVKGIAYIWQKIHFARATIKSALTVFLVFSSLILIVSLVAYPQLVYRTISNVYKGNPSVHGFIESANSFAKGIAETLAPIGWICSAIHNVLLSAAPGFRDFVLGLGAIIKPMTDLDNVGKYLVFQNVAAWISALSALIYGEFIRKGYRYKKSR